MTALGMGLFGCPIVWVAIYQLKEDRLLMKPAEAG